MPEDRREKGMNRQNQKIRNIIFSGQDAMLLIPPGMLKEAVVLCRESPEALIFLDEFFPPGLRDYLMKVLEANRHLPLFSRSVLHTGHAPCDTPLPGAQSKEDFFTLILLQLSGLQVDRRLWFTELQYEQMPDRTSLLHMKYTPEARKISREGGLFLYQPAGYTLTRTGTRRPAELPKDGSRNKRRPSAQKGGISFWLDPADSS